MKGQWHSFRNRIISGIFVLVPLAVTFFVLKLIFGFVAGLLAPIIRPFFREWPEVAVLAISLLVLVLLLYLAGAGASLVVGRRVIAWAEAKLLKLPLVGLIYTGVRQLVDTVSGTQRDSFKAVVIVPLPGIGTRTIGFVTSTLPGHGGGEETMVFVPTAPNPMSGFMLIYPSSELELTEISIEDGFKLVVSVGLLAPKILAARTTTV